MTLFTVTIAFYSYFVNYKFLRICLLLCSFSSQHSEDHLLGALMNVEMRYGSNKSVASGRGGVTSFANSFGPETSVASASLEIPIGIAPPHHHQIFRRSIKIDSDVQLMTLIQNRALLEELRCAATASSSCMSINTDRVINVYLCFPFHSNIFGVLFLLIFTSYPSLNHYIFYKSSSFYCKKSLIFWPVT